MNTSASKRTIKDIFRVSFSNIVSIFASVLVGFIIPRVLGIEDYGYYKTFTLYAGYIGLFHFGFTDGILLYYAGKKYEDLSKEDFSLYTRFLIILESSLALILALVVSFGMQGNYRFIFLCVAADLVLQQVMGYYQYILQGTSQFKEYSVKNIIFSVLDSIGVISLWLLHHFGYSEFVTFKTYVLILLAIYLVMVIWFVIRFRDITFHKATPWKEGFPKIWKLIKLGFPLLIANLCSNLILNFDGQFVNIYFENSVYAVYAFAYSILGMVTRLISAVTVVLYPTIKRMNPDEMKNSYHRMISLLALFIGLCLFAYYPMELIINWLLPKYTDSLIIFRIILPGLILSSVVSVVVQNYYKALGKPGIFFIYSAITLGVSIGLNFAAYYIFKATWAISAASIITLAFYYALTQVSLIRKYKVKWIKNTIYIFLIMAVFYGCIAISNFWLSGVVYLVSYILISLILDKREIVQIAERLVLRSRQRKVRKFVDETLKK